MSAGNGLLGLLRLRVSEPGGGDARQEHMDDAVPVFVNGEDSCTVGSMVCGPRQLRPCAGADKGWGLPPPLSPPSAPGVLLCALLRVSSSTCDALPSRSPHGEPPPLLPPPPPAGLVLVGVLIGVDLSGKEGSRRVGKEGALGGSVWCCGCGMAAVGARTVGGGFVQGLVSSTSRVHTPTGALPVQAVPGVGPTRSVCVRARVRMC